MSETKHRRSKYSQEQIMGFVYNEEKEALETTMDAEFSIELNHEDGDSVLSILPTLELKENQEKSCIGINTVVLYVIKGSAKVMVSPHSEGDLFFELPTIHLVPKAICAKRIKLVCDEDSEACLCGQG